MYSMQLLPRLAVVGLISLLSACAVTVKQAPITGPDGAPKGELRAAKKATGLNGSKVGWGRITLFAIPVAPVYIRGDDGAVVMARVHDALRKAGYDVTVAEEGTAAEGPTLKCNVTYFRFSNYTWLVPFVPTWGEVEVDVSLHDGNDQVLWSKHFEGDGFTFNFTDGYTIAANESLDEILEQLVVEFSSPEFVAHINATAPTEQLIGEE